MIKELKKDFIELICDELDYSVEHHLEQWMDRYYRKPVDDIVEDMRLNYDFSADIECFEGLLGRQLNDDEKEEYERLFLERVKENFYL